MDCEVTFDISSELANATHESHNVEMAYGKTYFSLGWGHLEVRLQSAFVQVRSNLSICITSCNFAH